MRREDLDSNKFVGIYTIILTVITVLVILFGAYRFFGRGAIAWVGESKKVADTVTCDPFTAIDVELNVAELRVEYGEEYKVSYDITAKGVEHYVPEIKSEGSVLTLKQDASDQKRFGTGSYKCEIRVTIPKGTELERLYVAANVGDIRCDGISCKDVKLTSNVGDMRLDGMVSDTLTISSNVGDVRVTGGTIETIDITSDVGDTEINGTVSEKVKVNCEIGDVELNNVHNAAGEDPITDLHSGVGDEKIN